MEKANHNEWLLDTGATNHMTPSRFWLEQYSYLNRPVRVYMGDDSFLQAVGIGQLTVTLPTRASIVIKEVYHIPILCRSLISVSAATSSGSHIEFFHGATFQSYFY
ncbi:hypothetical protein KP509_14G065900 [Ceratopteris richardii]|uniref:Retrovirus-related Pol polyprotein from transposon TNT 1-94-like beta-barrel domain-containing protein n=1 Tax=Ceratopteris richardii TaxID=49495 RepID=A0A8T2TDW5_CERRI|nr:hypothetical protein KP509_14G065900 [Ceratopteris richardii]